jgi:hypothetical protein
MWDNSLAERGPDEITAKSFMKLKAHYARNYPKSRAAKVIEGFGKKGYATLNRNDLLRLAADIRNQEDFEQVVIDNGLQGGAPNQVKARKFILACVNSQEREVRRFFDRSASDRAMGDFPDEMSREDRENFEAAVQFVKDNLTYYLEDYAEIYPDEPHTKDELYAFAKDNISYKDTPHEAVVEALMQLWEEARIDSSDVIKYFGFDLYEEHDKLYEMLENKYVSKEGYRRSFGRKVPRRKVQEVLDDNIGQTFEDPGYFNED